jgi:hypothetical protein
VKQANLRRSGRVVKRNVIGRDPTANRAQESHVDSPHSDSTDTDGSIHPGIAMLIDILAREALRIVIAEQMGLTVRDSITEKAARSVKRNQPTNVSRRCHKDETISGFSSTVESSVGEARAPESGQAR